MRRPAKNHLPVFGALALLGCAASAQETTPGTGGSSLTLSAGTGGSGASGGIGVGGGQGGAGGADVCTAVSEKAEPIALDLVFVIDRSGSLAGAKWTGTKSALTTFFEDPASAGISAGLVYFPTLKPFSPECEMASYKLLDVPLAPLPDNAFNLTNSMPANATGSGTPTQAALEGAAFAACAHQDAYPEHKVNIVLATDGDPTVCGGVTIENIAALAKSARDYNGVRTFVIGVQGATIANLDQIAYAGGTGAAYDVTQDINQFSTAMAEIRSSALACEFGIPPPPANMELIPDKVNFTYTPGGTGMPVTLPRADNLADCGNEPGWYYDNNAAPHKILLCPASCFTVQNDGGAEVFVAFGCNSVTN